MTPAALETTPCCSPGREAADSKSRLSTVTATSGSSPPTRRGRKAESRSHRAGSAPTLVSWSSPTSSAATSSVSNPMAPLQSWPPTGRASARTSGWSQPGSCLAISSALEARRTCRIEARPTAPTPEPTASCAWARPSWPRRGSRRVTWSSPPRRPPPPSSSPAPPTAPFASSPAVRRPPTSKATLYFSKTSPPPKATGSRNAYLAAILAGSGVVVLVVAAVLLLRRRSGG